MIIKHNIPGLNTMIWNERTNRAIDGSLEQLSSGLSINKAADDAAGLAIRENMRGQIRGLDMANKNVQDGISLIQTAEGGMQTIENMLQRMRELSVQAANDTVTAADRELIQEEVTYTVAELLAGPPIWKPYATSPEEYHFSADDTNDSVRSTITKPGIPSSSK